MTDQGDTSASDDNGTNGGARRRHQRLFPAMSFKEALFLANAIQTHASGQPVRRLTLFENLNRAPDGGTTRKLITSSNQYGLTTGSYSADILALTAKGTVASDPDSSESARLRACFDLAIEGIAPFKSIYDRYQNSRVPTVEVLRDVARSSGVPADQVAECVETFLANARELGLIRTIGGSEHLVPIEAVLDLVDDKKGPAASLPDVTPERETPTPGVSVADTQIVKVRKSAKSDESMDVCFVISPIGDSDSIERKHADLVLTALIEPALSELNLKVVRADGISKPGLITGQVIDHIAKAKLVIADLSFGNPNVYYELALRHSTRKPVVQIIRSGDKLPFDVGQFRTVEIDMTDIYVLVPQIDLHRQEITRQSRAAIAEGASTESPLSRFYPGFWDHIADATN